MHWTAQSQRDHRSDVIRTPYLCNLCLCWHARRERSWYFYVPRACLQAPTCCSSRWHWHAPAQRFGDCLLLCRPPDWRPMCGCVASPTQGQRWWSRDHQNSMQVFGSCVRAKRMQVHWRVHWYVCVRERLRVCMRKCACVWIGVRWSDCYVLCQARARTRTNICFRICVCVWTWVHVCTWLCQVILCNIE